MSFCKSDQKSMLMVGFLTHNDSDILRSKTGPYRRVGYQTNIPPTTDQSTPCPPQNSQPCRNSSRNIPGVDSSTQVSLHGAPPSYSSRRKMAASAYAWISMP